MGSPQISNQERIAPTVYEAIASNVADLASKGAGATGQPYTVGMMDWDQGDQIDEPESTPIGISRVQGDIESQDGWSRFTRFDVAAEPILFKGLNHRFIGINGQMEIQRDFRGVQLLAVLRTVKPERWGGVFLDLSVSTNGTIDDSGTHELYQFASRFGLGSIWQALHDERSEVIAQGWVGTRTGRIIARALSQLSIARS